MKKLNLIKRLWTDSHEKQKPQRFGRYAAMLIMLLILGVGQMWAANSEYGNGKVIYLDISNGSTTNGWRKDQDDESYKIKMYFNDSDDSKEIIGTYCCTRIGSSNVYYTTTNNDYVRWVQALRCAGSCGTQHNYSSRVSCSSRSYNHDNCIVLPSGNSTWWDTWTPVWTCYVPSMASATISKNASCVVYGGDGTSGNPYLIANSSSIVLDASATSVVTDDTAPTKEYKYWYKTNNGSRVQLRDFSSTSSYTFTASSTTGTTYEIDVEARNNNNSNYGASTATSSKIYFQTIAPIYAILGTFNSWTHSAATWDLTDANSDGIWEASFNLAAGNHQFKVVFNNAYNGKGSGDTYTTITRNANTAVYDLVEGQNNLKLTADYAGTYTFRYDASGKDLTVVFPTIYQVNYSVSTVGSGTGGGAITTDPSMSSGGYVVDGNSVTFTAASENSGYEWKGWYSIEDPSSNWSTGLLEDDAKYTRSITGTTTIYAVYLETKHDVTVNAGDNGTITTPAGGSGGTVTAGIASGASIAASANSHYVFKNWTVEDGNATFTNENNASTTVKATSDATVQANFRSQWSLMGDMTSPTWTEDLAQVENYYTENLKIYGFVDVTLDANKDYSFKFKDVSSGNMYKPTSGNTNITYSNKATEQGMNNTGGGDPNQTITTAGGGSYRFTWNVSDHAVKVTYPTSYIINHGIWYKKASDGNYYSYPSAGSLGASGSVSGDIATGKYAANGETVTFTVGPNSGYSLLGWYSAVTSGTTTATAYVEGSGVSIGDGTLALSIGGAKNVYPIVKEHVTTVTVTPNTYSYGTIAVNDVTPGEWYTTTTVGVSTTAKITATPTLGYYFTGWTLENGATLASGSLSDATIYIKGNGTDGSTGTATANFAPRWVLAGSMLLDGGDWDMSTNKLSSIVGKLAWVDVDLPANTTYEFKMYDLANGGSWRGASSSATINHANRTDSIVVNTNPGSNITIVTAAQGSYRFYRNLNTNKVIVSYPNSRQITMGIYTTTDGHSSSDVGGTISAVDGSSNVITNGDYVAYNGSVTLTATPNAGYIWQGWSTSSIGYGDPVSMDRVHTVSPVTTSITRYAIFEEALYNVTVYTDEETETTEKVGVYTHPSISVGTIPDGKVFNCWVTTGSAKVADPYARTTTITTATDNSSSVTATFKDLPRIYVDLAQATDWRPENMYAYFYDGEYWDSSNGTGANSGGVLITGQCQMTKIDGTNIWYYEYDPTKSPFSGRTIRHVAFSDQSRNSGYFNNATVTYRTDFQSCMNMFVLTDNTGTKYNSQNCFYRNTNKVTGDDAKGYWRNYGETNSGFYLNNLPDGSMEFLDEDRDGTYEVTANLDEKTTYYFYIGGCNSWQWSSEHVFNAANPTGSLNPYGSIDGNDNKVKFVTTAAGIYTFQLNPLNSGRYISVTITYPVAANDYRATITKGGKKFPSNIIKAGEDNGTISLWLAEGSNTISFDYASLDGAGNVTWTPNGSQSVSVDNAGVYTMTLTKSATPRISSVEPYEGDFYIRTNCAPGGWKNYTQNPMTKNTFNFKADDENTYDYYFCKWVNDAGTNVRCVVANDINMAISDTVKGEDILYTESSKDREQIPEGANVRFSWNSVTNTMERHYITGSSTNVFLNIIPDAASKVYQSDGTTDMRNGGAAGAVNKFTDLGNWQYEIDVKVVPNATAAVTANYNSTSQSLIEAGSTLIGGTGEDKYSLRLIYDFRTNYLMSAWMPNGEVAAPISLNSDMMVVRKGQGTANQLSFSDDGELSKVKRAYGVFEFKKSEMVSRMSTWDSYTYGLCRYYFSLPFKVKVSDIFGVGTMGDDWRIQKYNGAKRAKEGWFAGDGTTTFWEDVALKDTLNAYEGYCLMLNRAHFNNSSNAVWNNVTTSAFLYLPSIEPVSAITDGVKEVVVPSHECKIDRIFDQDKNLDGTPKDGARNHKYTDSHWNMMGTPLFQDKVANNIAAGVKLHPDSAAVQYIYEWNPSGNTLSARQTLNTSFVFKSMHAYMVQYTGTVTFSGASIPSSVAARRAKANGNSTIELELTKDEQFAGRTYVELRENAVDSFQLNEDMYMLKSSKIADIYSYAGAYELAANVLSEGNHIVPLGVDAKAAGTYTFSMPSNFYGTVVLVDNVLNTRTNLGLSDYEVSLTDTEINDRFLLEINIHNAPTAIDGIEGGSLKDGKAHKFIMNDQMYILKDGVIYDARGARVQ